jgi:hypothetical protein
MNHIDADQKKRLHHRVGGDQSGRSTASCQQRAEVAVETEGRATDEFPELAQLGHALL